MRLLMVAAACGAGLFASAGCSKTNATTVRTQIYDSCRADTSGEAAQIPNKDQFCGCLADKSVEGKSSEQLDAMLRNEQSATEAGQQAAIQCLSTIMGGEAK